MKRTTVAAGAPPYVIDQRGYLNYYPFGMEQPGRSFSFVDEKGRYGYNGKEKDNDWNNRNAVTGQSGDGNSYDYGFRMYNPRLGRWMSEDPVKYPAESPYTGIADNPILYRDEQGDSVDVSNVYQSRNAGAIIALELWLMTKDGGKWLGDRAQAGFKLHGIYVKILDIKIEKEGRLSKRGVDVKMVVGDIEKIFKEPGSGYAVPPTIEEGRLKLKFMFNIVHDAIEVPQHYENLEDPPIRTEGLFVRLKMANTWIHEAISHGFYIRHLS